MPNFLKRLFSPAASDPAIQSDSVEPKAESNKFLDYTGLQYLVEKIKSSLGGNSLHAWTVSNLGGSNYTILYDENNQAIGPSNTASRGIYFVAGAAISSASQYHPTIGYAIVTSSGITIQKIGNEDESNLTNTGLYVYNNQLQWRIGNNSSTLQNKALFIVKMANLI